MPTERPPVACTLGSGDYQERIEWITTLNRVSLRAFEVQERAVLLVYDANALMKVRQLVVKERQCCAFLRFDLTALPERVALTIRMPEYLGIEGAQLLAPFLSGAVTITAQTSARAGTKTYVLEVEQFKREETSMSARQLKVLVLGLTIASATSQAQEVSNGCWVQGDRADLELRASPFDSTSLKTPQGEVKVCYSHVRKLGRPGMGRLVPYGVPWRLGADEATSIYLPVRGSVAGVSVPAGWYSLYAVPGEREWRIVVNAQRERWGTPISDAVRAKDIGSGVVRVAAANEVQDLLLMRLEKSSNSPIELLIHWDRTVLRIPIVLDSAS